MECQECGQEADELVKVKVGKKTMKLCEDCASRAEEEAEVAGEAESKMRGMMEYKGKG
jgi:ribosome-binding protein aMBF1 (putative translation factor)